MNAKPPKSKARYLQCLGRGTRALPGVLANGMTVAERGAAIAASGKPDWFMHDITSTVNFHSPITAIDILLQGSKEIIQKVKEKQEDKETTPEELDEALAEAIKEQEALEKLSREDEKRRRQGLVVGVTFDSQSRDLFATPDAKSPKVRCYRFLYGRYKGMPLTSTEVPESYISWCIEKGRMTPFWMQVYKQELERRASKREARHA